MVFLYPWVVLEIYFTVRFMFGVIVFIDTINTIGTYNMGPVAITMVIEFMIYACLMIGLIYAAEETKTF